MSDTSRSLAPEARALVGDRLRRTRIQQGLSIRHVAQAAEISKTSVVQVEAGRSSRRSTYLKVAAVFGLHIDHLMHPADAEEQPFKVHQNSQDVWFDLANFGEGALPTDVPRDQLAQDGVVPLNILASRLEHGRIKPTVIELFHESPVRSHVGEEYVYVLEGKAIVGVGAARIELSAGESVVFWSAEPHFYAPQADSPLPVRVLSVRVDA